MTRVKNFLTPKWMKEFEELKLTSRKRAIDAGLLNDSEWGLPRVTSSQASGRKPSSPGSRVQASSPNDSVPRSRNQGTSGSSQA